jgi:hypothetical protein
MPLRDISKLSIVKVNKRAEAIMCQEYGFTATSRWMRSGNCDICDTMLSNKYVLSTACNKNHYHKSCFVNRLFKRNKNLVHCCPNCGMPNIQDLLNYSIFTGKTSGTFLFKLKNTTQ